MGCCDRLGAVIMLLAWRWRPIVAAVAMSGAGCAARPPDARAHPTIAAFTPQRGRFEYRATPIVPGVVYASRLRLRVEDERKKVIRDVPGRPVLGLPEDEQVLDVSLHRDLAVEASTRLRAVVAGDGPEAVLVVAVRQATVRRDGFLRKIRVTLELAIEAGGLEPLRFNPQTVIFGLQGAPHDLAEFDSVHLTASVAILDDFLGSSLVVNRINAYLAKAPPPPGTPDRQAEYDSGAYQGVVLSRPRRQALGQGTQRSRRTMASDATCHYAYVSSGAMSKRSLACAARRADSTRSGSVARAKMKPR